MLSKFLLYLSASAATTSIRGVSPEQESLYKPDENGMFACLKNTDVKISMDQINDNYCDCPDGSDEPGTSACGNGLFYCKGNGEFISTEFVDDGICDYDLCCDGSDEISGICVDKCAEARELERQRRAAAEELLNSGKETRLKYIETATERKEALVKKANGLESEISDLQTRIGEMKANYLRLRDEEDGVNVDPESLEALSLLRKVFNKAQKDHKELYKDLKSAVDSYNALNIAMQKMETGYNPNFNDPAVKEALHTWHNTPKLPPQIAYTPFEYDENLFTKIKIQTTDGLGQRKASAMEYISSLISGFMNSWTPVGGNYDSSSRAGSVRSAALKESIDESKVELKNLRKELVDAQRHISLGPEYWGPHEIGRALEEVCLTTSKDFFILEICFFGQATIFQNRRTVNIGTSHGMKEIDGKVVIDFLNGEPCTYGIPRSLKLILECGNTHQLQTFEEPEQCAFVVSGLSPLACLDERTLPDSSHEEL